MVQPTIITESINSFGDNVFQYKGEDYPFYQYNCSAGRELVQKLRQSMEPTLLCRDNGLHVGFVVALPLFEEMLATNDRVNEMDVPRWANEVFAAYGY